MYYDIAIFKPGAHGLQPHAWFLEIDLAPASVCVCMCLDVCVSVPEGINNQWRDMV